MSYTNARLSEYKNYIKGKTCAVLGVGISNIPLIRFLVENGAKVTARDKKTREQICKNNELNIDELEKCGVKFINGEDYLCGLCEEIIFKTPGLRHDNEKISDAYMRGAHVTSEMETFLALCPSKIIAVTGSDGKTTTTTLISEILKSAGKKVHLGGNIGKPLLYNVGNINPDDFAVLELSSFQLHSINRFENKGAPFSHVSFPDVAVVTNISKNHLDWHTDYEEYIDSKRAIFKFIRPGGKLVTNIGNEITAEFAKEAADMNIPVELFSSKTDSGKYYCDAGAIYEDKTPILLRSEIVLPGDHNAENYMAAIAATREYADIECVRNVARSFSGVEHRLEFVREFNGVKYYNSSIDSSPSRTLAAIKSFAKSDEKNLLLIMGGYDKNIPYDCIGQEVCARAKAVFLCGNTAEKIKSAVENAENFDASTKIFMCGDLKNAVLHAKDYAKAHDVVILTPASASFDAFLNFEQRGRYFKDIVRSF